MQGSNTVFEKNRRIIFKGLNEHIWYTTNIDHVEENIITLAAPETFALVGLVNNSACQCKITDVDNEITFQAKLLSIDTQFPYSVKIQVDGNISVKKNIREHPRTNVLFLADMQHGEESIPILVLDISRGGAKILCNDTTTRDGEVKLKINFPMTNIFDSQVELKGSILDNGRVKFVDNEHDSLHKLERYLALLKR